MIAFYRIDIDLLNLGCASANLSTFAYTHLQTQISTFWTKKCKKSCWKHLRCCWYIYPSCMKRSWWNFHSKVNEHMQIFCWDWFQPNKPLLGVTIHVNQSLNTLGSQFTNEEIHVFCSCQEVCPCVTETGIEHGSKKRARWAETKLLTGKSLHCQWIAGVWVVETVQNKL